MAKHALDTNIAKEFDVNIALLMESFAYWTFKNLTRNHHIYDGLCWSYDTLDSLCDVFPYWTRRQIERIINNAVEAGLLCKGNYNQTKYDRTLWYAMTPKSYRYFPDLLQEKYLKALWLSISPNGEMDFTEWGNGFHQTVTPIPITIPDTDPNINKSTSGEVQNIGYNGFDESHEKNKKPDYHSNQVESIKNDQEVIEKEREIEKSDYFENRTKKQALTKLSAHYDLKNILNENIFQVPESMICDWIINRKKKRAPITKTAWNNINKHLAICKEMGIDPLDVFETMVAHGWNSFKSDWFVTKEVITKHEASKKRSIELEQMAAKRKEKEIEDAKGYRKIVSEASEKERSRLRKLIGSRAPEDNRANC